MDGNPEDSNFDFWVPGNEDRNELEESENESLGESEDELYENRKKREFSSFLGSDQTSGSFPGSIMM